MEQTYRHSCQQSVQNIGIIAKVRHLLPQTLTRNLYFTLVHLYINYCNLIWASPPKSTKLDRIMTNENTEKELSTNHIFKSKYDAHSRPLFVRLSILNVYEVHKYQLLSHVFCISNNLIKNIYSQQYYKLNSDIHRYNARHRNNLNIPKCRTTINLSRIRGVVANYMSPPRRETRDRFPPAPKRYMTYMAPSEE